MSNQQFIQLMRALTAALAGLVWALFVIAGIVFSWASGEDPGFISSDGLVFILPGLTALVGGVVAVAFGVEAPKDPQKNGGGETSTTAQLQSMLSATTDGSRRALTAQGSEWLGRLYIGTYLLLGAVALVTWIFKGGGTIDYVRTLASAWAGLFLLIASSNFQRPAQPNAA